MIDLNDIGIALILDYMMSNAKTDRADRVNDRKRVVVPHRGIAYNYTLFF